MATRRRKAVRRRRRVAVAANPRRHRRRRVRRAANPVARRTRRRSVGGAVNPRHRRRHHRRRNPSGMRIGQIFKDMVYGAGGAVGTRVLAGVAQGLIPGSFQTSPLAAPLVQAGIAVTAVRWLGTKFLGKAQGDMMMTGGLISAGLALADSYFPNIQNSLTGIIRAPLSLSPQAAQAAGAQQIAQAQAAMGDVEDVPSSFFAGFGDVEDVQGLGI